MNKEAKQKHIDPTIYHLHSNSPTKIIKQLLRCKKCSFTTTHIIKQLKEDLVRFDIQTAECLNNSQQSVHYAENNFLSSTAAELNKTDHPIIKDKFKNCAQFSLDENMFSEDHICCAPNASHHHEIGQDCYYPICGDLCYLDAIIQQYKDDCGDKYSCLNNRYYPNHLLYFVQATNLIDPAECEHVYAFRSLIYKHAVYMNNHYPRYPHQIPKEHAKEWYPILDHLARLYGCACESEFADCCISNSKQKTCVHWSKSEDLKEQTQISLQALKELIELHKQELNNLNHKQ